MKKIWIAIIDLPVHEEQVTTYAFESEPTENQVKEIFFEGDWNEYDEDDWGSRLRCFIQEITMYLDK